MKPTDIKDAEGREKSRRRDFIKWGLASGVMAAVSYTTASALARPEKSTEEKMKVLGSDGRLYEVNGGEAASHSCGAGDRKEARKGMPGRKWVMVVDLARCKHALKCQKACNKHHHIPGDRQWLNVYEMQDAEDTAPYWMPKTCFHCDRPPCVAVCPVGATYKRSDGIVLIDNERCIGCRFCMAACPYSTRVFNWGKPDNPVEILDDPTDPEKGLPRKIGTVEKCDFCPDMLKMGKLPHCVSACPNGVFYFGDRNEDTVTNGEETVRFSVLMREKAGYRYLEDLGTEPNVYYLPAVDRLVPFDESENMPGQAEDETTHTEP